MTTFFSAILCKSAGLDVIVVPPDEVSIYNFAPVPLGERFENWVDESSPFKDPIPIGSRWIYSVHPIVETGDPDFPLKAGALAGGPFLDVKEAETFANQIEQMGWFVCLYAALIISDRSKLN